MEGSKFVATNTRPFWAQEGVSLQTRGRRWGKRERRGGIPKMWPESEKGEGDPEYVARITDKLIMDWFAALSSQLSKPSP